MPAISADQTSPAFRGKGEEQSEGPVPAFRLGHRRSLDGFRGAAILLVFLTHARILGNCFGFIGVALFFALSGFLITSLLLEEWDRFGNISLRKFYARRALRLLPALVALIIVFLLYSFCVRGRFWRSHDVTEALVSFFYSSNWAVGFDLADMDFLRHTWSLSIEEQFYFLWPLALWLMLKRATRNTMINLVLLGIVLSWAAKYVLSAGTAATGPRLAGGLDTRADALLPGCLVAMLLSFGFVPRSKWLLRTLPVASAISVAALGAIGLYFWVDDTFMHYAGWSLLSVFSSLIILQLMFAPGKIAKCLLENSFMVYVGRISYGLYLWNWPVFRAFDYDKTGWPQWKIDLFAIPTILILTLSSYYLLERPSLRLKARFQKVAWHASD
jgi:peptidoglycan/LPS O-acetylase OafA/YrhL